MKGITIRTIILAAASIYMTGCKETDSALNMANNEKMKDSVFKVVPEVRYIEIKIEESSKVSVTCGSKALFDGTDEKRQAIADELGRMTYYFHNEHNYLSHGKVKFVAAEDRVPDENEPGKENDMHLEDIVKANKK